MKKFYGLLIGIIFVLAACGGNKEIETNMSETVPEFEFTTQDNETLTGEDLKGKWWVADFIFTNCTTVCLPMTHNMSQLQTKLQEEDLDVDLVSFSVDPDYDTPEILKEYAEDYDANLSNWHFLTGYDFETIKELSIKTFRSMVQEPGPDSDQVTHGTKFYLIDPDGQVIKFYDGVESESMDLIIEDLNNLM